MASLVASLTAGPRSSCHEPGSPPSLPSTTVHPAGPCSVTGCTWAPSLSRKNTSWRSALSALSCTPTWRPASAWLRSARMTSSQPTVGAVRIRAQPELGQGEGRARTSGDPPDPPEGRAQLPGDAQLGAQVHQPADALAGHEDDVLEPARQELAQPELERRVVGCGGHERNRASSRRTRLQRPCHGVAEQGAACGPGATAARAVAYRHSETSCHDAEVASAHTARERVPGDSSMKSGGSGAGPAVHIDDRGGTEPARVTAHGRARLDAVGTGVGGQSGLLPSLSLRESSRFRPAAQAGDGASARHPTEPAAAAADPEGPP